jgi:hypothetical protein
LHILSLLLRKNALLGQFDIIDEDKPVTTGRRGVMVAYTEAHFLTLTEFTPIKLVTGIFP